MWSPGKAPVRVQPRGSRAGPAGVSQAPAGDEASAWTRQGWTRSGWTRMCGHCGKGLPSVACPWPRPPLVLEEMGLLGVSGMAAPEPSFLEMDLLLDTLDKSPGAGPFFCSGLFREEKERRPGGLGHLQ
ncbi:hypothetical protein HJG60_009650 [Phyllostomus discolor]|uniref:Uncharacterized protein n=1 Tax=Phyllostomus discolor TaxID=89673 RepID=A0A834B7Y8_9CHIR|nr:hypothetical protein HJG60_009650 [Phyllostomus discolor]